MKLSFQTITLIVFGFFIVFGVAVFAGYINLGGSSTSSDTPVGTVVMWGTVDDAVMNQFLSTSTVKDQTFGAKYVEKNPATYENDLVQAFASGTGPDIFLVTPEIYWHQRDKIYEIPYASFSLSSYTSTFMDISKMFLTPTGISAFPMYIDPMLGYWNKDIFASVGLPAAPKEWKEFPAIAEKISVVSNDYSIERSAFALGEYTNITHAKDIISLLMLQAGDPITHVGNDGKLVLDLGMTATSSADNTSAIALDFYGQFANPVKPNTYSWNKTFTSDKDQFLSGDLAYYFGYGSELTSIRRGNPNLNFDITSVPQANINGNKTTVGKLYGIAIAKQTKDPALAFWVIADMVAPVKNSSFLVLAQQAGTSLAPATRSMVPDDPSNIYNVLLYQSALISRSWIDPNSSFTNDVFKSMVSDLQSGKSTAGSAIGTARVKINAYLKTQ